MIPQPITDHLIKEFGIHIKNAMTVSGGCINACYRVDTNTDLMFLKWNDANRFPGMFDAEAKGLGLLSKNSAFTIPRVLHQGEVAGYSWLVMEFIQRGNPDSNYWTALGEQLAEMHQHTQDNFGLDHNNYIGSLHQSNALTPNWIDFFIHERIAPQLKLAIDTDKMDKNVLEDFELFYQQLPNIFPTEKPAFLHGDLWSGNLMIDNNGKPALVDPAVYYGHREMELAFTQLFGGFDLQFYEAYHDVFPLSPGFNHRASVYNLYPLLVHVNLFGGGYANQVLNILQKYL